MKLPKTKKKINFIIFLNLYFIIFIFILFFILFYIFIKNRELSYFYVYYPYFFIIFLLSTLISIFFFLKKKRKIIFFLIFNSFLFSLYSVELIIYYFNKNYNISETNLDFQREKIASNLGIFFDKRSKKDFFIDFKEKNKNTSVSFAISTNFFFNTHQEIFPLAGGLSDHLLIHCNENGNYTYYKSDRFGFNNLDYIWDLPKVGFLLVGDSFTQGACVNTNENEGFTGIFKKNTGQKVLNLGVGSSGLLTYYARIKEYTSSKIIDNLIIFFYEGDMYFDLIKEFKDVRLKNYIDVNYSQGLINNQKYSDLIISNLIDEKLNLEKKNAKINKSYNFLSFVKLQKLRSFMRLFFPQYDREKSMFISRDLLKNIRFLQPNARLFIICLPSIERYQARSIFLPKYKFKECSDISSLAKDFNYTVVDIHEELFKFQKDPKSFYPFGIQGHYNPQGYEFISKFLINKFFSE